jgi:hypothetical protein
MKAPWSSRWSWQLIRAVASMIALMVLVVAVADACAGHAFAAESQVDWRAQLVKVDAAAHTNDAARAVLLWREAYAAALKSRHWEGLIAVGDAYRGLGDLGGFGEAAVAKAHEIYLAALFRARQEASLDGVLRAAEAFAEIGDAEVVEQCLKAARTLAEQTRDARAEQRVHAFAEGWAARRLELEPQNGVGKGGNVR